MAHLDLDTLYGFLKTLRAAAENPEVLKALDAFRDEVHTEIDKDGNKYPIISVRGPWPHVSPGCLVKVGLLRVTRGDVRELLTNLEVAEPTDKMRIAVEEVRMRLRST